MIPPEAVLQASATMIVGVLFVVTIAKVLERYEATFLFWFCLWGVVPFSISAILALLELTEPAKWACIIGFIAFAFWLTSISLKASVEEG